MKTSGHYQNKNIVLLCAIKNNKTFKKIIEGLDLKEGSDPKILKPTDFPEVDLCYLLSSCSSGWSVKLPYTIYLSSVSLSGFLALAYCFCVCCENGKKNFPTN